MRGARIALQSLFGESQEGITPSDSGKVLMGALFNPRILDIGQITAPCLSFDAELPGGVPNIPPQPSPLGARCAWILVRVHTEPIGSLVLEVPPEGLTVQQVTTAISNEFSSELEARLSANVDGLAELPEFLSSRREILSSAPKVTVVVCTHERPERLEACLQSLLAQKYPDFSVYVVDNSPVTNRSKLVVERLASPVITYVLEPRKGLSRARNTALDLVETDIIAWIDDDETADPHWLAELARGFHEHPEADAVAGVMVPGEMLTKAQVWFEQYGGCIKLRGFIPAVFSPDTACLQSPLYPLPPFGSGGNFACRKDSMTRIGGFDIALGPGTPSMACEDTRMFTEMLCTGGTVVYQPTAVTLHFHRESVEELKLQMYGYGVGLTAFYTSLIVKRPSRILQLFRLLPLVYRDLFSGESLRSGGLPSDFPSELLRAKRRGMLRGATSYLATRFCTDRQNRKKELL
jgi:glycosyltransferase involved in cell wall biosynthesis